MYHTTSNIQKYVENNEDLKTLDNNFSLFDALANRLQRKTKQMHFTVASLTIILTATFLIYAKLFQTSYMLLAYVVIFVLGYAWYRFSNPNKIKLQYAFCRAISESLRIEFFWRAKNIIDPVGDNSLAMKMSGHGLSETKAITSIIKQSSLLGRETLSDSETLSENVLQDWLHEQKDFYKKTMHSLHKRHHLIEGILAATIITPIVISILLLIFYYEFKGFIIPGVGGVTAKDILVFLIGFIPVIGAVLELHATNNSINELYQQYKTGWQYLDRFTQLSALITDKDIEKAAYETVGVELSREHLQWVTITKQKMISPAHGG